MLDCPKSIKKGEQPFSRLQLLLCQLNNFAPALLIWPTHATADADDRRRTLRRRSSVEGSTILFFACLPRLSTVAVAAVAVMEQQHTKWVNQFPNLAVPKNSSWELEVGKRKDEKEEKKDDDGARLLIEWHCFERLSFMGWIALH